MKPYMLGTNTCSFIMRGKPDSVLERFDKALAEGRWVFISSIAYMELRRGACNPKASPKLHLAIEQFLKRIHAVQPFDQAAADASAKVYGQLAAKGQLIGGNDIAIAGHCIAEDCILVTNNTREFARWKLRTGWTPPDKEKRHEHCNDAEPGLGTRNGTARCCRAAGDGLDRA